ncbi:uncharacterized protein FTOL_06905 [Fusarium torulosum]|uniref:Uncharacterized protein n=1 Tax=Fusarium torulosum TaxID=33205 RepID=A0AAE8SIW7_9HYPO|nr:uncharacterized protein FTOL_06905 [Fusarium torulosum]
MRTAFFALAALPFFAIAQDPVPEIVPTTTTTSEAFVAPVVDTSTEVPFDPQPTTTDAAVVVPETTPEVVPEVPVTTTQLPPIIQDTTTQAPPPAQDTTTEQQPSVIDTTTDIPLAVDTTTGPVPVVDTTAQPIVQDTTTGQPSVQDTTTDLPPPVVDTTTNLPVVDTATQPIVQDTTTGQPLIQDTTTELPPPVVDTTTGLPVLDTTTQPVDQTPGVETTSQEVDSPDTTTQQPPVQETTTEEPVVQDTTTDVAPAETTTQQQQPVDTTTEAPVQETTTAAEQPTETTTQPEPKPTTEEPKPTDEEPKPTTKEEDEPVITEAPAATTAAPEVATASVSSVSSQVAALIPVINKWKDDPESLKEQTNKEVEDTHDDIIAVIVLLGGKPDVGCSGKRGLLGPIGDIINKLACMAKDLVEVSGGIIAGNVPAVTGAVSGVQGKNEELTDEKKDEDEKSEEKSKEESTKQEETTKEKSTEAPTTTEAPTSTVESTTTEATTTTTGIMLPCASDTCGGGDSCPIGGDSGKEEIPNNAGDINCKDIPTTTIDGPLPTKQGDLGDDPFTAPTARPESATPPSKRDLPLVARKFNDDMSPNPFYVASLTPFWVSQQGDTSGHWFGAPGPGGKGSAGVNGIYGCTAVIIVSDLGVYLSHIWENPVFIDTDWNNKPDDEFNAKAFEALRDGNADAVSVAALVGTDDAPGVLHSSNSPKVFVLTPFTSSDDRSVFGITTTYRYEERANALASNLGGIVPGSGDAVVLGYTRTNHGHSTEQYGSWGRAIVEYDMLEEVIMSVEDDTAMNMGLAMGRWRLWVEDQLVTSHKFYVLPPPGVPADTPAATPAAGAQKRAEEGGAHSCLVRGDSTDTASSGPTSTEAATSSDATSAAETTETSAGPSTETNAEKTTAEATTTDEATSKETTAKETSAETSAATVEETTTGVTTTQPPTTLKTSFITTTSAAGTTTETDTYTGPYPCVNFGGPRVETPHCQCSTTTAGQTFVTTAALISGQCHYYHEYPSPVTLAPTEAPPPPEPTPFTTTKDDGAILAYTDQAIQVGNYPGGKYTYTAGSGTPSTIRPADPVQTDGNNKGSSQCHAIDNACDRAIDNFKDDVIYTEFASYYARIKSGFIIVASLGQAGCVVEFDCDDWSVGGLNGRQIKDAYQELKDTTGVTNYCTNCNEKHQKID